MGRLGSGRLVEPFLHDEFPIVQSDAFLYWHGHIFMNELWIVFAILGLRRYLGRLPAPRAT